MKNKAIKESLKGVPLKTRLETIIEFGFIDLLVKLGYREDKEWDEEEQEKLRVLYKTSSKLAKEQLKEIKSWMKHNIK